MTQQQYDALVKAVGESVVQTLEKKGLVAKAPPVGAAPASSSPHVEEVLADRIVAAIVEIPSVLAGYRDIAIDLVRLSDRLDLSGGGGRAFPTYVGLFLLVVAAGLLVEAAVRRLTAGARAALARQFTAAGGW
jgi:hypothetical protein